MKKGSIPNQEEQPFFHRSKLWKKSWWTLSALMNAIGLINVGIDLKVVIFRWASFFERSFELIRSITNIVLYPFILLFGFFNIEVPTVIKDIFFFCFLLMSVLARAYNQRTRKFREEGFAKKFRRVKYMRLFSYLSVVFLGIGTGLGLGLLIAGISWLGFALVGNTFIYITFTLIFLMFGVFFVPLSYWNKSPQNTYLKNRFKEYILTVLVFTFLISLVNYYYITFTSTN